MPLIAILVIALILAMIIPNPYKKGLNETLQIWMDRFFKTATTRVERINLRLREFREQIKDEGYRISDLRGDVNFEINALTALKGELKQLKADFDFAVKNALGKEVEDSIIDKIADKEAEIRAQEVSIELAKNALDSARLGYASMVIELKKLEGEAETARSKEEVTASLRVTADLLEKTRDLSSSTKEIGEDLNSIEREYEKAKARFEDVGANEADRKLTEARKKESRDAIRARLESATN